MLTYLWIDKVDEASSDCVDKSRVNGIDFHVDEDFLFQLSSLSKRGKVCTRVEFQKNDEREMCASNHDQIVENLIKKYKAG